MEERIVELEIKLAYQDDLVQELNKIVASQQQKLVELERACRILSEQLVYLNAQQSKQTDQEIPPHY